MKRSTIVIAAGLLSTFVAAAQEPPRYEAFLGYTYVRANQFNQNLGLAQSIGGFSMNGGSGQFIYNFSKWIGVVADFGAVHKGNVGIINAENTTAFTLFGPRVYFRKGRFSPFGEVLFGAVYREVSKEVNGVTNLDTPFLPVVYPSNLFPGPDAQVTARISTSENAFAMEAGGGLDYRISKHFSYRPVEVDYVLTRFPSLSTGTRQNQSSISASTGIIFAFGGEKAAVMPQAMKACPDGSSVPAGQPCPKTNLSLNLSAAATEVCPGEAVNVTPSLTGAKLSMVGFQWSVNGQNVSQGPNFTFETEGKQPGTYTIKAMAGGPQFNTASAETNITVKAYVAPSATVNASPMQIYSGDKSTVSASCSGQCGGPLKAPTFSASEGSIEGDQFDSSTVSFDGSNNAEQRKTVTITASCADDKNVGTGTAQIEVIKKATIAPIRLHDILFSRDSARVNNCGKRVLLEQLRSYYERDTGGSVVLVGHQTSDEKPTNLSDQRALNAAAVVSAGSGICMSIPASQVQVSAPGTDQNGVDFDPGFCESSVPKSAESEQRRVVVWFVPSGGQMPTSVTNMQPASSLSVSSLGCPK